MTSFFGGLFGFGKKRSTKKFARDLDDDVEKESSYPRASKPAPKVKNIFMEESPFEGATPVPTGSWIVCQDVEGNPFWCNDVTGQCTYQLYSTSAYAPPQMIPSYLFPQQYAPQYVLGHHHQQQQQHSFLMSPSGANQQSPWDTMVTPGVSGSIFGGQDQQQQGEGFVNVSDETWNRSYHPAGRDMWVHRTTGQRVSGYPMNS